MKEKLPEQPIEQLSFEDHPEITSAISERSHWIEVRSYYHSKMMEAEEKITELTVYIANLREWKKKSLPKG